MTGAATRFPIARRRARTSEANDKETYRAAIANKGSEREGRGKAGLCEIKRKKYGG
jgi:hypothetical protein